jgi:hypothetical protein
LDASGRKITAFRVVAYAVMIIGILLFGLTPLFIRFLKFDTDILGLLVVLAGLAVLIVGSAVRLIIKRGGSGRVSPASGSL